MRAMNSVLVVMQIFHCRKDTRLLGTLYFAAPEQFGYGFSASTIKADIYAVGILLNMMLTGKLPKESRSDPSILYCGTFSIKRDQHGTETI